MSNGKIRISISHRKLWEDFHRNNNEMILTSKGRCIYPRIGYSVEGLEPKTMYFICLKICRTDRARYKYTAGEWHMTATGDSESETKYIYPDNGSTQLGQYWMSNGIRFGKLKITNSNKDCSTNILLTSMHKYRPILYIHKVYATPALCLDGSTILTNQYQLVKSFTDQIMEFIAVTAYQNQRIIEMKKIHNSYARGQRGGTTRNNNNNNNNTFNADTNNAIAPITDDQTLRLSISPLNKYKPYWTNKPHYFSNDKREISRSVHLLSSNCNPSATATAAAAAAATAIVPICPSNSSIASGYVLSANQQNSSTSSVSPISTLNDSGNTLPSGISNLQKPSIAIEQRNFMNSSNFPTFNHLSSMWNYSTLWHHFSVPHSSLVTHNPPYI
uniref:T-box domain-containing protein n=1 Tax=Elaeophora elaphi TaxID=1147741 RepID=A0A0R3S2H9_9BILA